MRKTLGLKEDELKAFFIRASARQKQRGQSAHCSKGLAPGQRASALPQASSAEGTASTGEGLALPADILALPCPGLSRKMGSGTSHRWGGDEVRVQPLCGGEGDGQGDREESLCWAASRNNLGNLSSQTGLGSQGDHLETPAWLSPTYPASLLSDPPASMLPFPRAVPLTGRPFLSSA